MSFGFDPTSLPAVPENLEKVPAGAGEVPIGIGAVRYKPSLMSGAFDALTGAPIAGAKEFGSNIVHFFSERAAENVDEMAPELKELGIQPPKKEKVKADVLASALATRKDIDFRYAPDPATSGPAAQLLYALGKEVTKVALSTAATAGSGIGAASAAYGLSAYQDTKLDLLGKGVDEKTATKSALASGIGGAVGMLLPVSAAGNLAKRMATGAALASGSQMAENAAIQYILNKADYSKISDQYSPFDFTSNAVSGTFGALIGGVFGRALRTADRARMGAAEADNLRANQLLSENTQKAQDSLQQVAAQQSAAPRPATVAQDLASGQKRQVRGALSMAEREAQLRKYATAEVVNGKLTTPVLQNRDRTTAGSIDQLNKIASDPQFLRVAASNDFGTGAPVIAYARDVPAEQISPYQTVAITARNRKLPVQYALVESDTVLTSNRWDGTPNQDYGVVAKPTAIAGNGRVAALQEAYRRGTGKQYKTELAEHAEEFGFSSEQVQKMRRPILVRIMRDSDVTSDIGAESNEVGVKGLTPVEQASADMNAMTRGGGADFFDRVKLDANGAFTTDAVKDFVAISPDRANLLAGGNKVTAEASARMARAASYSAYRSPTVVQWVASDEGKGIKSQAKVLENLAPTLLRVPADSELDISQDLLAAVNKIKAAKDVAEKNKSLTGGDSSVDWAAEAAQQDMFAGGASDSDLLQRMIVYYLGKNDGQSTEPTKALLKVAKSAVETTQNNSGGLSLEAVRKFDLAKQFYEVSGLKDDPVAKQLFAASLENPPPAPAKTPATASAAKATEPAPQIEITGDDVDAARTMLMTEAVNKDQPVIGESVGDIQAARAVEEQVHKQLATGQPVQTPAGIADVLPVAEKAVALRESMIAESIPARDIPDVGGTIHVERGDVVGARETAILRGDDALTRVEVEHGPLPITDEDIALTPRIMRDFAPESSGSGDLLWRVLAGEGKNEHVIEVRQIGQNVSLTTRPVDGAPLSTKIDYQPGSSAYAEVPPEYQAKPAQPERQQIGQVAQQLEAIAPGAGRMLERVTEDTSPQAKSAFDDPDIQAAEKNLELRPNLPDGVLDTGGYSSARAAFEQAKQEAAEADRFADVLRSVATECVLRNGGI